VTRRKLKDKIFAFFVLAATLMSVVPLFIVIADVSIRGASALSLDLLFDVPRGIPLGSEGGIVNAITGTLMLVSIAFMVIPLGLMVGVYLNEHPRGALTSVIRISLDSMAWVPSIVWGMFGYVVFVLLLGFGFSALAGGITLGLMILPYVAKYTEESLAMVPREMVEGSFALGAKRYQTMFKIAMRAALVGIVGGIVIGTNRMAGETAPLLFTAYWSNYPPTGLFGPVGSLPYLIWYYSGFPYPALRAKAYAASLILMLAVLSLTMFARFVSKTFKIVYR
jgi:phosphate transport system permease protein